MNAECSFVCVSVCFFLFDLYINEKSGDFSKEEPPLPSLSVRISGLQREISDCRLTDSDYQNNDVFTVIKVF